MDMADSTLTMNKPEQDLAAQAGPGPARPAKSHWGIILTVLLILGVVLYLVFGRPKPKPPTVLPPTQITTVTAKRGEIAVYVDGLGSVVPEHTVSLTSQVNGQIKSVSYVEGQIVKPGDPLVDIEPSPFLAQLTTARGQLERDKALLEKDLVDLSRYEDAWRSNAINEQQLADQRGQVQQDRGTVLLDEGTVSNAQVQVSFCHITSPINGRVGLRLVDPGNVVSSSPATPLVSIAQLQPITVIFSIAQLYVPDIQQELRENHKMQVDAFDQRGYTRRLATGEFLAMDNLIDTNTGSIRVRAIFTNEDNSLYPNQFVNARLQIRMIEGATLVPTEVIQRNAQEAFVYIVQPDTNPPVAMPRANAETKSAPVTSSLGTNQIVVMTPVKIGITSEDITSVEGIEPGDVIAANNFNRLQDHAKVVIRKPAQGGGGAGHVHKSGDSGAGGKSKGRPQAEQDQ